VKNNIKLKIFFILMLISVIFLLSSCEVEPTTYAILLKAPDNCDVIVQKNGGAFITISAGTSHNIADLEGSEYSFQVQNPINNYGVKILEGQHFTTLTSKDSGVFTLHQSGSIILSYIELPSVSITAPSNTGIIIKKEGQVITSIDANNTYSIVDYIGSTYMFVTEDQEDSNELMIVSGDANVDSLFAGTFTISKNDSIMLSYNLMPTLELQTPDECSIDYVIRKASIGYSREGSIEASATIQLRVPTNAIGTIVVDGSRYHLNNTAFTEVLENRGSFIVDEDKIMSFEVSYIPKTLIIEEPSPCLFIKVFTSEECQGAALTPASSYGGKTIYNLDTSFNSVFLKAQISDNVIFSGWNDTTSFSDPREISLLSDSSSFYLQPLMLSTIVEPNIAYVAHESLAKGEPNGSKGLPFTNIQEAIDSLSSGEVRIENGHYSIESIIELNSPVSLYGGYSVDSSGAIWTKPTYGGTSSPTTIITSSIIASGSSTDIQTVLLIHGSSVDETVTVQGLEIGYDGNTRSHVTSLKITGGATPTISDCVISGGNAINQSYGVYIQESNPIISESIISAGNALTGGSSIGLYNTGSPTILDSTISSNQARKTYGIINNGGSIVIKRSIVTALTAGTSSTDVGDGTSIGIQNENAKLVLIEESDISCGGINSFWTNGSYTSAIINKNSTTSIVNCTVLANDYQCTNGAAIKETNSKSLIQGNIIKSRSTGWHECLGYSGSNSESVLLNNQITRDGYSGEGGTVAGAKVLIGNIIHSKGRQYDSTPLYNNAVSIDNALMLNNTIIQTRTIDNSLYITSGISTNNGSIIINNLLVSVQLAQAQTIGISSVANGIADLRNNGFFDIQDALVAPRGSESIYYVKNETEFTESRIGICQSRITGNVAEGIGTDDVDWTTNLIFTDFSSGNLAEGTKLRNTAPTALKEGGLVVDESILDSLLTEIAYTGLYVDEIEESFSSDINEKTRDVNAWAIGALQY